MAYSPPDQSPDPVDAVAVVLAQASLEGRPLRPSAVYVSVWGGVGSQRARGLSSTDSLRAQKSAQPEEVFGYP